MKIIIADDHGILRHGMVNVLKTLGHEVVAEADNIQQMIDCIHHSAADLLLTDCDMPNGDIFEALTNIRADYPDLKIVVLTGLDNLLLFKRLLANEIAINGILTKKAEPEEVVVALESVMYGNQYIQMEIRQRLAEANHGLTDRQLQVLELIIQGYTNIDVANELNIALKTVDGHRTLIMKKLKARNVVELIKAAKNAGLTL